MFPHYSERSEEPRFEKNDIAGEISRRLHSSEWQAEFLGNC
jgi:hypothetical protein